MFLAADTTTQAAETVTFHGFDVFMILFTLVIAWGVFRSITAKERNKFAIGFGTIALLVFLAVDVAMVMNWFGLLG
jgi:uncharacterized membrane protein (UPF0182 family)